MLFVNYPKCSTCIKARKFLENLGFVPGGTVTVISEIGGNVIVNVKDSRVAVSKEMASKIMV